MAGNLAIANGHGYFESGLFSGYGYLKMIAINGADATRIQIETGANRAPFIERVVGGVTTSSTSIATATPPVEYDLPLASGWTHINSDDPLQYGKCGDGRVQLMGIIIAPAGATAGQQIATLPAGYRPVGRKAWLHAFDANTGIDYGVMATPDGPVTLWVTAPPANATLVFPVQSFYAA